MLKVFRDNLKYLSWVLWVVVAVFVLFTFSDFGGVVPGRTSPREAAAEVGRHRVSFAEFENAYRQLEDNYRRQLGESFSPELARQLRLPLQVLDHLVAQKILLAEAGRLGLDVTDEELRREILKSPAFQDDRGRFVGEEAYRQFLRSRGLTVDGFEASVREDLLLDKLNAVLAGNLYVPEKEVEEAYRERVERARIRYLALGAADIDEDPPVSDAEVRAYFDAHTDDFRQAERRVAAYVLVDTAQLRASLEIPEAEARAYYDEHAGEFTDEEQVRARHILLQASDDGAAAEAERRLLELRGRIEAGEDFATLAGEHSQDPGSRDAGGDLGFFGRGQMIAEFEEAAFSARPGELVGPVRTTFGVHLLEVLERRAGGQRPFEEVASIIRTRLAGERAEAEAQKRVRDLRDRAAGADLQAPGSLEALAAGDPGVEAGVTQPFGRQDTVPGIGRETEFTRAVFELDRDGLSEVVPVPRGLAIAQLREIQPPRVPDLVEVDAAVRAAVVRQKRIEAARGRLAEARQRMAGGETLEGVASTLGLEVEESDEFGRQGAIGTLGPRPELAAAVFELSAGEVGGPLEAGDQVVLFEVAERTRFDAAAFEAEKDETRADLRRQRVNQLLTSLIQARRQDLHVRYNPQLLENFGVLEGSGVPVG